MNDDYGGGSLTALPVIETQVEEYILRGSTWAGGEGEGEGEGRGKRGGGGGEGEEEEGAGRGRKKRR